MIGGYIRRTWSMNSRVLTMVCLGLWIQTGLTLIVRSFCYNFEPHLASHSWTSLLSRVERMKNSLAVVKYILQALNLYLIGNIVWCNSSTSSEMFLFEISSGTLTLSSKWSLGSAVDFKSVSTAVFWKRKVIKFYPLTKISPLTTKDRYLSSCP
jgi:hypothetical protein